MGSQEFEVLKAVKVVEDCFCTSIAAASSSEDTFSCIALLRVCDFALGNTFQAPITNMQVIVKPRIDAVKGICCLFMGYLFSGQIEVRPYGWIIADAPSKSDASALIYGLLAIRQTKKL